MPASVLTVLIYAGIVLLAFVVIGIILTRLYRRATKDVALIRTGFGGEKVVLNGGIMVIPVLHELMPVRLTTVKLEVSRLAKDALITQDKLRVDVVGLFHIKVKPDAESIAAAAQTLGDSVNSAEAVKSLLDGKLVSALRSVAATMTMEHLHANRADFIQKVQEALLTDLDMNGFQLESVSITHFDQTAFEHFNENNAFDAEGLTVLTRTIEERKKTRNDIVAANRVAIEQRNLEANNQSLEIAQAAEQATAIATATAEQTRLAEIARIEAEQAQTVAQTEADKVIQTATIARDGAIQTATIERDRTIEIARITTAVQTAQKSEEESTATAAANEARALAVRAEESVATAKATEIANRNKNVAVIAATQRAQEEAVQITVAASAEKEAAEARASALRTEATAEADAEKARAAGREAAFKVDAAGQASLNEATNILSDAQTALLVRKAMLDALPAIIAAAARPIENIDKISILDARGLHGDSAGNGGTGGGQANLADAAVAAAMRYRVGGPLIDGLMAELGMAGGSLDGMLAGSAPSRDRLDGLGQATAQNAIEQPPKNANGSGGHTDGASA